MRFVLLSIAALLSLAAPARAECVPEPLAYCYVPFPVRIVGPRVPDSVLLTGSFSNWARLVSGGAIAATRDGEEWTAVGFFEDAAAIEYKFLVLWPDTGLAWCLPGAEGGLDCGADIPAAALEVDCGLSICSRECEPVCEPGEICVDGLCETAPCEPLCTFEDGSPRACGPDGCDGVCGECEPGLRCVAGGCVPEPPWTGVDVVAAPDTEPDAAADTAADTASGTGTDADTDTAPAPDTASASASDTAPDTRRASGGCAAGGAAGGALLLLLAPTLLLLLRRRALPLVLLAFVVACAASGGEGGGLDAGADDLPDLAGIALPDAIPPDQPSLCGDYCPVGFCDEATGLCEYCEQDEDCRVSTRVCREHRCQDALCAPERARCLDSRRIEICDADGMGWTTVPCHEDTACVGEACVPMICESGETRCQGTELQHCGPTRTEWVTYPCPLGALCFEGTCRSLRSNLVVIFDTSGSMADPVDCLCEGGCPGRPFPACEQDECPATLMGSAKKAFRALLTSPEFQTVNAALLHFPMHTDPTPNSCAYGFYEANHDLKMSGDDGRHETSPGGWFDQNLHEILAVRFPSSLEDESRARMALWFDNDEQVAPSEELCASREDCPGGFCRELAGVSRCWYHTNPEMRAHGGTPLGRMLYYAGEIFRRHIHVEDRACRVDADCGNLNYTCEEGACHDRYRFCRTNMILLLTDGVDSSPAGFFDPLAQAKRLRFGLCCESDRDCFPGSRCVEGDVCGDYAHPNAEDTTESSVAEGPCRLFAENGEPIQVYTHVIDVSLSGAGALANRQLADAGGGQYHYAVQLDAETLLQQMLSVLDAKVWLEQCVD